jgi:hypothetical protein
MKDNFILNALLSRASFYDNLLDGRYGSRDVDEECGYPKNITIDDYILMYRRNDVAARVVNLEPEESWNEYPMVYETDEERKTPFESAVETLSTRTKLFSYLVRLDTISGIGRYGVLFIGLDDGEDFSSPAPGFTEDGVADAPGSAEVLYYRVFDESSARISKYETDRANPRYGLPVLYDLTFQDSIASYTDVNATPVTETISVHWSRVVHVADVGNTTSEIFGFPRMENVFNRLFDLRKINAGAGEMYWKGGFPGYSFEVDPQNGELTEDDREGIKDEIFKWEQGLSRYFAGVGVSMKSLQPQISNPQPFVDNCLRLISTTKGIPVSKLLGSTSGMQMSPAEEKAWTKKIALRRDMLVTPVIIHPVIERLQQYGALPPTEQKDGEPQSIRVKWTPLAEMTETEKAEVGLKRTEALARYATAGAEALIPLPEFLTKFLKLSFEEAEAITKAKRTELSVVLQELAKGMTGQQNNVPSSIPAVPKPGDTKDPSKTPANVVQPPKQDQQAQ